MSDDLTAHLTELELSSNSSTGDRGAVSDPHTQAQIRQINLSIEQLRQLTQVNVQSDWQCWSGIDLPWQAEPGSGSSVNLNPRGHIAWQAGEQLLWLEQKLTIPVALKGCPLLGKTVRLCLRWWAKKAEIFVNDQLVQAGDIFDSSVRLLLSSKAIPGETFTLRLELVSPGHDAGALVYSYLVFESDVTTPDPGFVADELAVLRGYLEKFQPEKLDDLVRAVALINWPAVEDLSQFERSRSVSFADSLTMLRQKLQPLASWLKQRRILLLGHAHLDLAWLWPVSETWEVAERTFQSALNLQQEFPDWIFCHSSPALYAWIEEHKPDLFAAIQQQVAAGRWEVVAGLWIEPELNLVSGESLVRQVLYGQLYGLEKFGALSCVAWLPDSFGFCWQLPQILQQGGVEYFVTQKLRWNDTTQFPHEVFWWRSPDGSQIFSLMSALIGEAIEPVKMAEYAQTWEARTQIKDALWLPGVGDHGGGPTREMLEVAQRWQHSSLFPRLESTTAEKFLRDLEAQCRDQAVPIWTDELYLEFHRGCYTTHADQKWWNRRCEQLLYQAELFAAVRSLLTGATYPKAELESAWKQVLFNQFHDILPGSAIPEVFADANREWAEVEQAGTQILRDSQAAIAREIALPPPPQSNSRPIVVFNSLNWARSEVVSLPLPSDSDPNQQWQIYDFDGNLVPTQVLTWSDQPALLFQAPNIPSVGYRVFWLGQTSGVVPFPPTEPENYVLENDRLRVVVDPDSGNLSSIFDKVQQRQILNGPGNQLQFFQDSGQYWDAWNIDPEYAKHPLPAAQLKRIEWLTWGPLQTRLRVLRQFGQSQFCQDYILEAGSAVLKISTTVNWQDRQVLVKAAFPLTVQANYATYEISCGAIQRPTLPNPQSLEPSEAAKWEVPALQWADLSSPAGKSGASLLNDCKYGYDAQPDQLRLTLLRSPSWPDPNSDRGFHQFTYALYPHSGSWQAAQTPQRGYELNQPLQVCLHSLSKHSPAGQLPAVGQFLNLQSSNLILMALKQAEADSQAWILRCYECCGETAQLDLQSDLNLVIRQPVDLLERPISKLDAETSQIDPWKIASFAIAPRDTHL